jgi:hypothetical protein
VSDVVDPNARTRKLVEAARDAQVVATAARVRRDQAIREAVDAGTTPRRLCRGHEGVDGIGLSEGSVYRILGTAPAL